VYGHLTIDRAKLMEAGGQLSTANFPDALRMGIQTDLFSTYNEMAVTYPQSRACSTASA
jgi:hypothetical protein